MEINGKKYDTPSSWKDVNVRMYLKLVDVIKKEYENEFLKTVDILSAITDVPADEIRKNESSYFIKIQRQLNFINKLPSTEMPLSFNIGMTKYETVLNPNKLTTGEFIDLDGHTKSEKDLYANLPTLLAVFYRPVINGKRKETYTPDEIEERKKLFNEKLSIDKVFGAAFFFLSLRLLFLSHTSKYSTVMKIKR